MRTLIFITIIATILLLTPYVFSLTAGENATLTDMYNEWGKTLNWTSGVSNACSWKGITCTNGDVASMFVKF